MDLFVNDLSLHGQFGDHQAFRRSLEAVIQCRDCAISYRRTVRVARSIVGRPAIGQADFRQAVLAAGDKNFVSLVISWIAKNGPFVEDELLRNPSEYLVLTDDTLVTEEAIGEAATRHFQGLPSGLVSFAPSTFQHTPVEVSWHRDDENTTTCELSNYWSAQELDHYLEGQRQAPATWGEFIEQLPARFPNLYFLPHLEEHLAGETFSPYVVERTFVLLGVLNELKICFDANGRLPSRTKVARPPQRCCGIRPAHRPRQDFVIVEGAPVVRKRRDVCRLVRVVGLVPEKRTPQLKLKMHSWNTKGEQERRIESPLAVHRGVQAGGRQADQGGAGSVGDGACAGGAPSRR